MKAILQLLPARKSLASAILGFLAASAPAQLVNDGETNVLDNVTNFIIGHVTVGTNAPFASLVMTNAAYLTNTGNLTVGMNNSAVSNLVWLTDAGSRWDISNNCYIGQSGSWNLMIVSNTATLNAGGFLTLGNAGSSRSNLLVVTGSGTMLSSGVLQCGNVGSANRVTITDGGFVKSSSGSIGSGTGNSNNEVMVGGVGSFWTNSSVNIGDQGSGNCLVISNGGVVKGINGTIGFSLLSKNHEVVVTGTGSSWQVRNLLRLGVSGPGQRLSVNNGGTASAGTLTVGVSSTSLTNTVTLDGGNLFVTNTTSSGVADIRYGRVSINSGYLEADSFSLTNGTNSGFIFNSGTLRTRGTTSGTGTAFTVGNGTSNATFQMLGGTHIFSNNLVISPNATLTGNGLITGNVTNSGTIAPGSSAGGFTLNGDLYFQPGSTAVFELGGVLASNQYDQIAVTNYVQFGGTLDLRLTNGFLPAPGDTFTLVKFNTSFGIFNNAINGERVSLANGLASFHANYDVNFVLSDVQYVDSDGDGQGDLQELAAGTDPNNSASALAITSVTQNASGNIVVQFQSVAGKNYRVEYGAVPGPWSIATTNVPSGGASTTWIDDGSLTGGLPVGQRFYRIGLQ